jgi:hypothetical protein
MGPNVKSLDRLAECTGVCAVQFPEKKVTVAFWRIEK